MDQQVTSPKWQDFYLIPMNQSLGTVSPTHFTIIRDQAGYAPDQIQKMAYQMTHMYFNWTGNVKVPAVCQYCQKLLDLTVSHLKKEPSETLSKTLFYLWIHIWCVTLYYQFSIWHAWFLHLSWFIIGNKASFYPQLSWQLENILMNMRWNFTACVLLRSVSSLVGR